MPTIEVTCMVCGGYGWDYGVDTCQKCGGKGCGSCADGLVQVQEQCPDCRGRGCHEYEVEEERHD